MTVGFVCEAYLPYSTGGAEESVEALASSLSRKGIRVVLVAPNVGRPTIRDKQNKNRLFPVPFHVKKQSVIPPIFLTTIFFQLYSVFWIWRICRQEHIDILHVHGKYMIVPTMIAGLFLRKSIFVSVRDYIPLCPYGLCLWKGNTPASFGRFITREMSQYLHAYVRTNSLSRIIAIVTGIRGWFVSWGIRQGLRKADHIIFLSALHREIFRTQGFDGSVIGNVVNLSRTKRSSQSKNPCIVFIGRLSFGKGTDIILDAFQKILAKYPQSRLTFVGDGPARQSLELQASAGGPRREIKFTGFVEREKVGRLLQSASVVVLPGRWPEPFGRVAAEALLAGVPVVASSRGGWSSFIDHGKTGLLVDPSIDAVAEAVMKVLEKQTVFRQNIGEKHQEYQYQFGPAITSAYIKMYEKIIGGRS